MISFGTVEGTAGPEVRTGRVIDGSTARQTRAMSDVDCIMGIRRSIRGIAVYGEICDSRGNVHLFLINPRVNEDALGVG
jgi:hypothetical protein